MDYLIDLGVAVAHPEVIQFADAALAKGLAEALENENTYFFADEKPIIGINIFSYLLAVILVLSSGQNFAICFPAIFIKTK